MITRQKLLSLILKLWIGMPITSASLQTLSQQQLQNMEPKTTFTKLLSTQLQKDGMDTGAVSPSSSKTLLQLWSGTLTTSDSTTQLNIPSTGLDTTWRCNCSTMTPTAKASCASLSKQPLVCSSTSQVTSHQPMDSLTFRLKIPQQMSTSPNCFHLDPQSTATSLVTSAPTLCPTVPFTCAGSCTRSHLQSRRNNLISLK